MFHPTLAFAQAVEEARNLFGRHARAQRATATAVGNGVEQRRPHIRLHVDQQAVKVAPVLVALVDDGHELLVVSGGQGRRKRGDFLR